MMGPRRIADRRRPAIDRASVHRLTSGQVVIDLQTAGELTYCSNVLSELTPAAAVKELLENALDARATSICACCLLLGKRALANQSTLSSYKSHHIPRVWRGVVRGAGQRFWH